MVYCGKASQGCQNCRIRRIKCDKVKPECSQCIRVGKKCPGYRDQLSLMFRDESSKVIQKAHAQWGVGDSASEGLSSRHSSSSLSSSISSIASTFASSVSTTSSSTSHNTYSTPSSAVSSKQSFNTGWPTSPVSITGHQSEPPSPLSPASFYHTPSSTTAVQPILIQPPRLPTPVDPSLEEQGIQFYVNRYLIGHPDEPGSPNELPNTEWLWDPSVQDVMTAVGLASLANLKGDSNLMTTARQRYGMALRQTGRLIQTSSMPDFEVTMRSVIMLAMFECIPAYMSATPLPDPFYEWIAFARTLLDSPARPSTDLGSLIGQFIQVTTYVKTHTLTDGRPLTSSTLKQLLDIDASFEDWESKLGSAWRYRTEKDNYLPSSAVFGGEYHVYYDMFIARMWGHYRWARTLLNQAIVEFIKKYPNSSAPLVSLAEYGRRHEIIRNFARDILVSTPTHWRHPLLTRKSAVPVENKGGAGSGSAGLPIVLFHLQVAACAPGVPVAYWNWALGVMECIWSDMGLLYAKSMMEAMRSHRDSVDKVKKEMKDI
ncbi:hypothetical protein F66182_8221 [Fusarium sp. NRRL 66182]|nr:hypothetical protein F66182_8221 [Fusarium sp. NRRL 66182]